jgi:hypothetical protein
MMVGRWVKPEGASGMIEASVTLSRWLRGRILTGRPPPHPRGAGAHPGSDRSHRAAIAMPTLIAEIGVGLQPPEVGEHVLESPCQGSCGLD